MKKKKLAVFCLILMLVLSVSIQSATAYFTTFAEAKGGEIVQMGGTEIRENFYNWTKHVVISNNEDSQPVYVRARALAGSQYPLSISGEGWYDGGDGYWYYDALLNAGESTPELIVMIDNLTEDPAEDASFNVVVLYESVLASYNEDGQPYPDWTEGGDAA